MKTRLLIRPNSDIRILDTVYILNGGNEYVGLLVEDLNKLDIQEYDIVSLEFNDTSLNPQYDGTHYVLSITDYPNVITLRTRWGRSGPTNTGFIRNWTRIDESVGSVDESFVKDRTYNFDINQLEVDRKGRYIHGGLYDNGTYSNVIGGRILQTGEVDSSFLVEEGFNDFPRSILMYDDGSMIIGGKFTSYNGSTQNYICKLYENGTIDPSFIQGSGFNNYVYGLAKHGRGIVVVGSFTSYNGVSASGIIKLKQDGSIDLSFDYGSGLSGSDRAYSVLCTQPSTAHPYGQIVVGGEFAGYDGNSSPRVVRINGDGSYDSSFSVGTGADDNVLEIKEDVDKSIIICGGFTDYNGNSCNGIASLDQNGSFQWTLPFNSGAYISSFDIQSNNKYLISGDFTSFDGNSQNRLVRLNSDRSFDSTFDIGTGFNGSTSHKLLYNGQIVAFGSFTSYDGQPDTVRLTRLNAHSESIRNKVRYFDLLEDIQFPLSMAISDIREPNKRKSDFSKTITLPGTKNNIEIFNQYYEFGSDSSFNPNFKKNVIAIQDGLEIMIGNLKLDNVSRKSWNDIEFNVKISGQLIDMFSKLVKPNGEDLKLNDLDLSEYNHSVNKYAIYNSWMGDIKLNGFTYSNFDKSESYTVTDTGFYEGNFTQFILSSTHSLNIGDVVFFQMDNPGSPTVNFDESNGHHTVISTSTYSVAVNLDFKSGDTNSGTLTKYVSLGKGYVYPTINFGVQDVTKLEIDDYRINFYAKNLLDEVFSYIKFSYESDFFNTEYFNRLTLTGNQMDYAFRGTQLNSQIFTASNDNLVGKIYKLRVNEIESDPTSKWNTENAYYQNGAEPDTMRFNISFDYQFSQSSRPDSGISSDNGDWYRLRIYAYRSLDINGDPDTNWTDDNEPDNLDLYTDPNAYGNWYADDNVGMAKVFFDGATPDLFPNYNSAKKNGKYSHWTNWVTLRPYEKIKFMIVSYRGNGDESYEVLNVKITDNVVDINRSLPDMTAKNFLLTLIQMHNMYLEPSRSNQRKIYFEPYNRYYSLGSAKDWTNKVDISIDPIIEPISPDISKNFVYKYADDSDYLNTFYKNEVSEGETYGTFETSHDTDFNSSTTTITVVTPQTLLEDRQNESNIIIPTIIKDINGNKIDKFKTRILYWTGIRWSPSFNLYSKNRVGNFVYEPESSATFFQIPMYGYAGHFDNPVNATIDLNFGVLPKYLYGNGYSVKVTNNNLFNRFYKSYFEELTDDSTKILTAYLKLNSYDISNLSFRDLIYIKDNLWRLESIEDYNPLTDDSTKCTFIKVKQVLNNDQNISTESLSYPIINFPPVLTPSSITIGNGNSTFPGTIVNGRNNTIYSGTTRVTGTGNMTDGDSKNIDIVGDNNSIVNTTDSIFFGSENISDGTGSNIWSIGNSNDFGSVSNIYNFGNNNTFPDGLTNSYVFGNNVNATQSDSVYFGGNIIFTGTVSGLTASIPHYDAIGYYKNDSSNPANEIDQFIETTGPYISVVENEFSPGPKSVIIGDSLSNNSITTTDAPITNNGIFVGQDNIIGGDTSVVNNTIIGSSASYIGRTLGRHDINSIIASENSEIGYNGTNAGSTTNNTIIGSKDSNITGLRYFDGFDFVYINATQSFIQSSEKSDVLIGLRSGVIAGYGVTMSGTTSSQIVNAVSIARNNFIATQSNTVYLPNVDVYGAIIVNGSPLELSTQSSVIGGSNNYIYVGSTGSAIVGGDGNYISASEFSTILGGQNNYIELGSFDTIVGSLTSNIYDSEYSNIVASVDSTIATSSNSAIFGSDGVHIGTSSNAGIISSKNSNIIGGPSSSMFGTFNSNIWNSVGSSIFGGNFNLIDDGIQNGIIGGELNHIYGGLSTGGGTRLSNRCYIINGTHNDINNGWYSNIFGGEQNYLDKTYQSLIFGGLNNSIYGINSFGFRSEYSYIFGSNNSNIYISRYSSIKSSSTSGITASRYASIELSSTASIIGSSFSQLTLSDYSLIDQSDNSLMMNSFDAYIGTSSNSSLISAKNSNIIGGPSSSIFASSDSNIFNSDGSIIIGGSDNDLNGGTRNGIYSAQNSQIIGTSSHSLSGIFGGSSNSITDSSSSISIGGIGSYLTDSFGSINIGGITSEIDSSLYSSLINSSDTDIINGDRVFALSLDGVSIGTSSNSLVSQVSNASFYELNICSILGGVGNDYNRISNSSAIGGSSNEFNTSDGSLMVGGQFNTMTQSDNSIIIGGRQNTLKSPGTSNGGSWGSSVVIGGISNTLTDCGWSVVAGGDTNTMSGFYSGMVGGSGNVMGGTYSVGNYCFQGGGSFNNISASASGQCRESGMLGGIYNTINAIQSGVVGGAANKVAYGSPQSFMAGGNNNTIDTGWKNSIIGGDYNRIHDGDSNTILSSFGSTISACNNTTIIGGTNILATQSNTLYTGLQIHVGNSPTISPESSLASATIVGNDMAGRIDFEIGGSPATGLLFTITWNQNFPNSSGTVFSNGNVNTFLNALTWTTQGPSTLEMNVNNSLSAGSTFSIYYNNSPW